MNTLARSALTLAFVTCACAAHAGSASIVCVDNIQALPLIANALGQNGVDDDLRLVAGTYKPDGVVSITVQESHQLLISGGWNEDCSEQNGGATVFDGQGTSLLLHILSSQAAPIGVTDITFINAASATSHGLAGALGIYTSGLALAERNLFIANRYAFGAPALGMSGRQATVARNNLFVANTSSDDHAVVDLGCSAFATSTLNVAGNTMVGNQVVGTSAFGGLRTTCVGGTAYVANNLLWNNDGGDLRIVGADHTILYDNDIGVLSGDAPGSASEGNFSAAPVFRPGILNFAQASSSPAINRGRNCFVDTMGCKLGLGETDLSGMPRIQGARVDIGAYESDVLLYSGYEVTP